MKKAISLALSCAAITSWAPGAGAAEAKERFGNWQVQTLTDKMDDSTRGIALLRSSSAPTVLMLVKCDYAGDGVYIQFSGPVLGERMGARRGRLCTD
ncbi:hypothetical protein [Achromobacter denitrificans]|uniref:DUF3617 family protein n=1 Tax=Achromobacter denitrificans TaxID=32002 RepID=A0A6N0JX35_ACHDE|nr:hypothetical protein [Achromobacter denitrificans]QKQ51098.1 hypothetical protein FOC81_32025 [Achromobacter denitrificans]